MKARLLLATLSLFCTASFAAQIDETFGVGGSVAVSAAGASTQGGKIVRQADGKIITVGFSPALAPSVLVTDPATGHSWSAPAPPVSSRNFIVARFNADGTMDNSFGGDGVVDVDFNGADDRAMAVIQQPDGKLVVVGQAEVSAGDFDVAVARLNVDGSLDASFADGGKRTIGFGKTGDIGTDVILQPDGKLLVGGGTGTLTTATVYATNTFDFAVLRLMPNGNLDTGYGSGTGTVSIDFNGGDDGVSTLMLRADGKLIAAGNRISDLSMELARLDSTGMLDASFGAGGKVSIAPPTPALFAITTDALQLSDEKLVIAGFVVGLQSGALTFHSVLVRLTSNGALDASFGVNGQAVVSLTSNPSSITEIPVAIALQPNGKFLLGGYMTGLGFVARLTAEGGLDDSFGSQGLTTFGFIGGTASGYATDFIRSPDGKLLWAGNLGTSGSDGLPDSNTVSMNVVQLISDPQFSLSASTPPISESQPAVSVNVTLSGTISSPVSVTYNTPAGSATAGSDFASTSGTLTWQPGDPSTKTITVSLINDAVDEADETFTIALSNPSEGSIAGTGSLSVTITDDDPPPQLALAPSTLSVSEGQTSVNLSVAITGSSASPVSVNYMTASGTATAGSDFTAASGTLTWQPGDSAAKTLSITLNGDGTDEPDETFTVTLSAPTAGATLATPTATVTITDDDVPPPTGGGGAVSLLDLLLAAGVGVLVKRRKAVKGAIKGQSIGSV